MFVKNIEPYFCKIEIEFESGIIPDFDESGHSNAFTWVSGNQDAYKLYVDQYQINPDQLSFQILLDRDAIYSGSTTANQVVVNQSLLIDTTTDQQHVLKFELSGMQDQHMQLIDSSTSIRTAVKLLSIKIENIDITPVFNNFAEFFDGNFCSTGGVIFSTNSVATLSFSTPIYQWLIQNEDLIVNKKYRVGALG